MFIIGLKMIKYKLQIQHLLNIVTVDDIYYNSRKQYVMMKIKMVIKKSLRKKLKTNSATGHSRATILPPIGDSFMYIETISINHGNGVFVSFERSENFRIGNISFYCNRYLVLTNNSLKAMGRFGIQLLIANNTWSTRYKVPKNDRFINSSTQWTKISLNYTVENNGIKLT